MGKNKKRRNRGGGGARPTPAGDAPDADVPVDDVHVNSEEDGEEENGTAAAATAEEGGEGVAGEADATPAGGDAPAGAEDSADAADGSKDAVSGADGDADAAGSAPQEETPDASDEPPAMPTRPGDAPAEPEPAAAASAAAAEPEPAEPEPATVSEPTAHAPALENRFRQSSGSGAAPVAPAAVVEEAESAAAVVGPRDRRKEVQSAREAARRAPEKKVETDTGALEALEAQEREANLRVQVNESVEKRLDVISPTAVSPNIKPTSVPVAAGPEYARLASEPVDPSLPSEVRSIIEALKKHVPLPAVDLSECGVSNIRALTSLLKYNTSVTRIDVSKNPIGDAGARDLADLLKTNTSITSINVESCRIRVIGGQALGDALRDNKTLRSLDISRNTIEDEGCVAIGNALKRNGTMEKIKLGWTDMDNDGMLAIADALAVNNTLTSVDLTGSVTGNQDYSVRHGPRELARALARNSGVTTLYLQNSGFGPAGAQELGEALKTNKTLRTLDLSDAEVSSGLDGLAAGLAANNAVETLRLCGNFVGLDGAGTLAKALSINRTLVSLDLSRNAIGEEEITAFLHGLGPQVSVLHKLNLSGCPLSDDGALALASALGHARLLSGLTRLKLSRTGLRDDGVKAIAQALESNETLEDLDLSHNSFASHGAFALAHTIKLNRKIRHMDLSRCQIGDEGIRAIGTAVRDNDAIHTLILAYCSCSDIGAFAIAQALSNNKALKYLDLSSNFISDDGVRGIANALQVNRTLTTIDLCDNRINEQGAMDLSDALASNQIIQAVYLGQYGAQGTETPPPAAPDTSAAGGGGGGVAATAAAATGTYAANGTDEHAADSGVSGGMPADAPASAPATASATAVGVAGGAGADAPGMGEEQYNEILNQPLFPGATTTLTAPFRWVYRTLGFGAQASEAEAPVEYYDERQATAMSKYFGRPAKEVMGELLEQPYPLDVALKLLEMAAFSDDYAVRKQLWAEWVRELGVRGDERRFAVDKDGHFYTFRQAFLQSFALDGVIESYIRHAPDDDIDVLQMLGHCLRGTVAMHKNLLHGLRELGSRLQDQEIPASLLETVSGAIAAHKIMWTNDDPSLHLERINRSIKHLQLRLSEIEELLKGSQYDPADLLAARSECTADLLYLNVSKQKILERNPEPTFVANHFTGLVEEVDDVLFHLDSDMTIAKKDREEGIRQWEQAVSQRNKEMSEVRSKDTRYTTAPDGRSLDELLARKAELETELRHINELVEKMEARKYQTDTERGKIQERYNDLFTALQLKEEKLKGRLHTHENTKGNLDRVRAFVVDVRDSLTNYIRSQSDEPALTRQYLAFVKQHMHNQKKFVQFQLERVEECMAARNRRERPQYNLEEEVITTENVLRDVHDVKTAFHIFLGKGIDEANRETEQTIHGLIEELTQLEARVEALIPGQLRLDREPFRR